MRWTEEMDAELRRRHALGESYGVIARSLRITRNAAIGRGTRLGLQGRTPSRPVKRVVDSKPLPWSEAEPRDPQRGIDTRDLAILDALAEGRAPAAVAKDFRVTERHVRDLWAAREAQDAGGEGP